VGGDGGCGYVLGLAPDGAALPDAAADPDGDGTDVPQRVVKMDCAVAASAVSQEEATQLSAVDRKVGSVQMHVVFALRRELGLWEKMGAWPRDGEK
jgi:hypothetical protein